MGVSRSGGRDGGAVATALVVVVAMWLLFLTASFLLPVGQASDQRTSTQSAADAAALAAATRMRLDLPVTLTTAAASAGSVADLVDLGASLNCGTGSAAASAYARANGSTVTSYCYLPASDRIQVRVQHLRPAANGAYAQARAVARLGPEFGACQVDPTGPNRVRLRCGELRLDFALMGSSPRLTTTLPQITAQLRPRLVG